MAFRQGLTDIFQSRIALKECESLGRDTCQLWECLVNATNYTMMLKVYPRTVLSQRETSDRVGVLLDRILEADGVKMVNLIQC